MEQENTVDSLGSNKNRWDAQIVVQKINARHQAGLSISSEQVRLEDGPLWAAARRYYGSWANAVKAAHLPAHDGRKAAPKQERWSRERILKEIQEYADGPEPLYAHHMRSQNNKLVSAATYYFGSWSRALEAAGFNPHAVRASVPWSKDRVLSLIIDAQSSGADLKDSSARFWNRPLYRAACEQFGSWSHAVAAATGSDRTHAERWSRERIEALVITYLSHGFTVKDAMFYHPRLSHAINDAFGNLATLSNKLGSAPELRHEDVASRLRHLRERRGWTADELANSIQWPLFLVKSFESGEVPVPWHAVWIWAKATSQVGAVVHWTRRDAGLPFGRRFGIRKAQQGLAFHKASQSNSPCFVVGQNGYIQYWSDSLSHLTGLSRDQAEGQLCSDIVRTYRLNGKPYCAVPCPVRQEGMGARAPVLTMKGLAKPDRVKLHMLLDSASGSITHWLEGIAVPASGSREI